MIEAGRHAAPFPPRLTTSPAKASLFSVDTYFTETWAQVSELCEDPTAFAWEHGILVLKPDAFASRRAHVILQWLEDQRFEVAAARRIRFDRHAIRALWRYQWNMATQERKALFDLLLAVGDSILLVVRRTIADDWPTTVALTDAKGPAEVASRLPHHLRTRLGGDSAVLSYLHTADEPADVLRELGIHCDEPTRGELIAALSRHSDFRGKAEDLCDQLYSETPAHSLDAVEVGARLERLAKIALAGTKEEQLQLLSLARQIRHRERVVVEEVRASAERCEVHFDRWDEIAITASQIVATIPGVEPVLRTRARDWDAIAS